MADDADKQMAADKAKLTKDNEARQKARAEHEKAKGRPTPTQEECDLMKLGHHPEISPSGAGPDVQWLTGPQSKQSEPAEHHGGGGYQTRQSTAAQHKGRE